NYCGLATVDRNQCLRGAICHTERNVSGYSLRLREKERSDTRAVPVSFSAAKNDRKVVMKNGLLARRMVTAALLPACLLWGPVFSSESQAQSDTSVQNPPAKQRKVTVAPPRRPAP